MHSGDRSIPFGRVFEESIVATMKMMGHITESDAALDHNHKLDLVITVDRERIGLQISLRDNFVKAVAAKNCALDVVDRFFYVTAPFHLFSKPNTKNGKKLSHAILVTLRNSKSEAFLLRINATGFHAQEI